MAIDAFSVIPGLGEVKEGSWLSVSHSEFEGMWHLHRHLWLPLSLGGSLLQPFPCFEILRRGSRHTWQGPSQHCWKVPESPGQLQPCLCFLLLWVPPCLGHLLKIRSLGPPPERLPQALRGPLCFVNLVLGKGTCWVRSTWELFNL